MCVTVRNIIKPLEKQTKKDDKEPGWKRKANTKKKTQEFQVHV